MALISRKTAQCLTSPLISGFLYGTDMFANIVGSYDVYILPIVDPALPVNATGSDAPSSELVAARASKQCIRGHSLGIVPFRT